MIDERFATKCECGALFAKVTSWQYQCADCAKKRTHRYLAPKPWHGDALKLHGKGLTNAQIGEALGVSATHVQTMMCALRIPANRPKAQPRPKACGRAKAEKFNPNYGVVEFFGPVAKRTFRVLQGATIKKVDGAQIASDGVCILSTSCPLHAFRALTGTKNCVKVDEKGVVLAYSCSPTARKQSTKWELS